MRSVVLAYPKDDGLEDEHRARGADNRQRLTGKQRVDETADRARHQHLHRSLYTQPKTMPPTEM